LKTGKKERGLKMKRLLAVVLLSFLLIPSASCQLDVPTDVFWQKLQDAKVLENRLTEIAYEVYGNADDDMIGVFQTHGHLDFDIVIYYRTFQDKNLMPFEQLYFDLFQYEMLERFFADDEVNGLFFSYCWNYESGGYGSFFKGSITREAFESIDLELYDELFYFEYLDIKDANKLLFPQFYY